MNRERKISPSLILTLLAGIVILTIVNVDVTGAKPLLKRLQKNFITQQENKVEKSKIAFMPAKLHFVHLPAPPAQQVYVRPIHEIRLPKTVLKTLKIKPIENKETAKITQIKVIQPLQASNREKPSHRAQSPAANLTQPTKAKALNIASLVSRLNRSQNRNQQQLPLQQQPQGKANKKKQIQSIDHQKQQTIFNGRTLLRLLEHGKGPNIEISWPRSSQQRDRLFDMFTRCYGMVLAVMTRQGQLYKVSPVMTQKMTMDMSPWKLNRDYYSGFIRQSDQVITQRQDQMIGNLFHERPWLNGANIIRLFPRSIDAILLGGLRHLIGGSYGKRQKINAVYRIEGTRIYIESIHVDHKPVKGKINLSDSKKTACA